jgi:hypothetical protein
VNLLRGLSPHRICEVWIDEDEFRTQVTFSPRCLHATHIGRAVVLLTGHRELVPRARGSGQLARLELALLDPELGRYLRRPVFVATLGSRISGAGAAIVTTR